MTVSVIAIDKLSKRFGNYQALKEVSLEVAQGEIHGLIGLNGAGKTTLIKCLLDLLKPDSGAILLQGEAHDNPKQRKNLQFLPEKFIPSAQLRGFEYLKLTLGFYELALDRAVAEAQAQELALRASALSQMVAGYSKGMGQKLGLLAILLANRHLWVLDEPMSGLDPEARALLKRQLRQHSQQGGSVFFSSHILSDIDEICDRISIIHFGHALFTGTPTDFKDRYSPQGGTLEDAFLTCIEAWNRQHRPEAPIRES